MRRARRGMALLATLWILAILLVLAATFALGVRTEVVLAGSYVRRAQAYWLAEAGLQRAFVELQQSPQRATVLVEEADEGEPLVLRLNSQDEEALAFQDGRFVVSAFDESSRVNINTIDEDILRTLLPDEPELVDAILDWRDTDDIAREAGAESDYYAQLDTPYRSRDDWFETITELMLLRDVTAARLFPPGELSPLADEEQVGEAPPEVTPLDELFTTTSYDQNVDLDGEERLQLGGVTEQQLQEEFGDVLSPEEIQAIVNYGGEERQPQQQAPAAGQAGADGAAIPGLSPEDQQALDQAAGQLGEPPAGGAAGEPEQQEDGPSVEGLVDVLERETLRQVYDRFTNTEDERRLGTINLNTASAEVLSVLPGMDESLAQLIVTERQQEPFETVADLLRLSEIDDETFKEVAPYLSTRSLVYRLTARGTIGEGNQALSNTIEALVTIELAAAAAEDEAGATTESTTAEDEPPTRVLRLVYRRME